MALSLRCLDRQLEILRVHLEMGDSGLHENPDLETFNLVGRGVLFNLKRREDGRVGVSLDGRGAVRAVIGPVRRLKADEKRAEPAQHFPLIL